MRQPLSQVLSETGRPDVLVLGAGQAGLTAAVAAAQQGARVLVIEKLAHPGGSTAMSSGLTAYAGTDEQRALGIEDTAESLKADILATGQHRNDEGCDQPQSGWPHGFSLSWVFDLVSDVWLLASAISGSGHKTWEDRTVKMRPEAGLTMAHFQ